MVLVTELIKYNASLYAGVKSLLLLPQSGPLGVELLERVSIQQRDEHNLKVL